MLAFTGFNGFGQFGCSVSHTAKFESIFVDDSFKDKQLIDLSCSWRYTAFAYENIVELQGLLTDKANSKICVTFPEIVKQICASDKFCLILLENGKLFKLLPSLEAKFEEIYFSEATRLRKRSIFGEIKPLEPIKITHIAVGTNISVAISNANAIFNIPSQIYQFSKHVSLRQLVCGFEHALLLTSNGDVYTWGNGIRGQLGVEPLQVHESPVLVEALAGIKILSIAAGGWHSAAISSFGDIYTWGFNSNGQLGLSLLKPNGLKAPSVYPLPQLLDLPVCCTSTNEFSENSNCTPVEIVSGARHLVLKLSCGSLMAVGWNKHGQLGTVSDCKKDYCDKFKRIHLEEIFNKENLKIYCGPWTTIVKSNDWLKNLQKIKCLHKESNTFFFNSGLKHEM